MATIYIADDEPTPIRVLKMNLERTGFNVETFVNGRKALERIREHQPDALITDIEMPVLTGESLCKQIHDEFPDRNFPIFVVTSVTDLAHRDWAKTIDNLTFLEKPVSMRKITADLKNALGWEASSDA